MRNYQVEAHDVPDDWNTDEFRCVVVRVPFKPEYVKAFYDSWFALTSWLSWKKDENKTAVKVSKLWRQHAPKWVACDVIDELDEDGNMAINVNVTTNCNCGSSDCGCIPGTYEPNINGNNYNKDTCRQSQRS